MRDSALTFRDFTQEFNSYVRIVWNGKEIYNDNDASVNSVKDIDQKYGYKKVYSLFVRVVYAHHCELYIEGES